MKSAKLPDFRYEKAPWKAGFNYVGGIDEVGRGSFAGPVVAGCVVFSNSKRVLPLGSPTAFPPANKRDGLASFVPPASRHPFAIETHPSGACLINDSKKLNARQREAADKWIRKNALAFGIGQASVSQINRLGIKKATEIAFRKAIKNSTRGVEFLLIDAFFIPYVKGLRRKNQKAIVKGDEKSISIAAASIIAKVYRDKLMADLGKKRQFKKYKWDENKGYGTLAHRRAILKYGISRHHRRQFVETWEKGIKSKESIASK